MLTCYISLFLTAANILDVTLVESDSLSMQNTFRSWLHDCGTDSEHLHLILPPPPSTLRETQEDKYEPWELNNSKGTVEEGRGLMLKCDIHERIIDPSKSFESKIGDLFVSWHTV
jgi:hypothetical protein